MRSWVSPYQGMGLNPISFVDPLGLEESSPLAPGNNGPTSRGDISGAIGSVYAQMAAQGTGNPMAKDAKPPQAQGQEPTSTTDKVINAVRGVGKGIGKMFQVAFDGFIVFQPTIAQTSIFSPPMAKEVRARQKDIVEPITFGLQLSAEHFAGDWQGPYHQRYYAAMQDEADKYQRMSEPERWAYGGEFFAPLIPQAIGTFAGLKIPTSPHAPRLAAKIAPKTVAPTVSEVRSTAVIVHPFSEGGTHITTTEALNRFAESPTYGRPSGLFVAPSPQIDVLLATSPSRTDLEIVLGLTPGTLQGGDLVRINVPNVIGRGLSQPVSGNKFFRPGTGVTWGGLYEGVVVSPFKNDPEIVVTPISGQ